jgi:hypothetical protein
MFIALLCFFFFLSPLQIPTVTYRVIDVFKSHVLFLSCWKGSPELALLSCVNEVTLASPGSGRKSVPSRVNGNQLGADKLLMPEFSAATCTPRKS